MNFVVYNKGEILYNRETSNYIDQLTPELVEIPKRYFCDYLKDNYDLTTEEYYNLVVFDDKDRKVICPVCGGVQEFNSLLYPYYKCCNNCRSNYNFSKDEDVLEYVKSLKLPDWVDESYLPKLINARTKVIINSYKGKGKDSDIIMEELKNSGKIKRSKIADYVKKGLLKQRYLNRTNLYDYLINKGFLHYEVQFLIVNDL